MNENLKKIKNGWSGLYYLRFTTSNYDLELEDYTKPRSFIIKGVCELYARNLNDMIVKIADKLSKLYPEYLNDVYRHNIPGTRMDLFVPSRRTNYLYVNHGLWVYNTAATSKLFAFAIRQMLELFHVNLDDCFLVVQQCRRMDIPDNRFVDPEEGEIALIDYVNNTYKDSNLMYKEIHDVLSYLNNEFSFSVYEISSLTEYNGYMNYILEHELCWEDKYNRRQVTLALTSLREARFYGDNLLDNLIKAPCKLMILEEDATVIVQLKDYDYLEN